MILSPYGTIRSAVLRQDYVTLYLAASQRGQSVGFATAAALGYELTAARDENHLLSLQSKLTRLKLLIVDELSFVPLSKTGAELVFEVFIQRYERGSAIDKTNLPFNERTKVFGSERLTRALLDRLTHRIQILEMDGESCGLRESRKAMTLSTLTRTMPGTRRSESALRPQLDRTTNYGHSCKACLRWANLALPLRYTFDPLLTV